MPRKKERSHNNTNSLTMRLRYCHAFESKDLKFADLHELYEMLSPEAQWDVEQIMLDFDKKISGMGPKCAFELTMKLLMWLAINPTPRIGGSHGNEKSDQAGD
jgi:hypothetical protein